MIAKLPIQWPILRRLLDLALCGAIVAPFQACTTLPDVLDRFVAFNALEIVGLLTLCVFLAADVLCMLRDIKNWIWARLHAAFRRRR